MVYSKVCDPRYSVGKRSLVIMDSRNEIPKPGFLTMDFSEEEIREELSRLGYHNVPYHRLQEFKKDLSSLIEEERSQSAVGDSYFGGHTSQVEDDHYGDRHLGRHDYRRTQRFSPRFDKENYSIDPYEDPKRFDILQRNNSSSAYRRSPRHLPQSRSYVSRDYDREFLDYGRPAPRHAWGDVNTSPSKESVISEADSTASSDRRVIKRKVVRKHNGESRIFNESVTTESDPDELGVSRLSDRLNHLRVVRGDDDTSSVGSRESQSRPRQYFRSSMPSGGEDANKKAVIFPEKHPHTKNLKKNDPVARYQQAQQSWKLNKAPGEKKHKDLRWGIREQMLYHDEVVKKTQRTYVPNSYVVPTEKKRKSLVWQVRTDMAQGNKPPVGGFS